MAVSNAFPFLLGSLNIGNMKLTRKQQLLRMVRLHKVDILAVQETKISTDQDTEWALRPFLEEFEACVTHAVGFSAGFFLFFSQWTWVHVCFR